MSNATKCDRCGGFYEQGGNSVCRQGYGVVATDFDLCPDCAESFDAWMERGPMADAPERVTNEGEMLHDTGVSGYRYHIIRDGMMRMVVEGSDLKDTDVVESVEEPDTREKLEADVDTALYGASMADGGYISLEMAIGWLDRQAAITEREFFETACHGCERLGGDGRPTLDELCDELRKYTVKAGRLGAALDERDDQLVDARESLEAAWDDNAELRAEIATLKEHRAGNMERLHELTDECAELRKYRDEWKGLAEKYRADSIAAQEETERYRAKLGDVLDSIHEAERAAR